MTASLTRELAAWAASLSFEDIPHRVVKLAKLQIQSVLGALFAGYGHDAAQRVYRVVAKEGGPVTLLPNGESTDIASAVWAHASFGVVHDFDDYLFAGHTGHSSVLASLAFSEQEHSSGRDFLVAQTIANELGGRLGASLLFGPQNGQMWSYIHNLGASASGARLMGLDADGIRRAISIALAQPPYPLAPGFFDGESKILIAAEPAAAGARAAALAREGMTGAEDALGGQEGFLKALSGHPLDWMFGGLGDAWVSDSLTFKIVPGCAYIDGAVDCLAQISKDFEDKVGRSLEPADVASIKVWGNVLTYGMEMLGALYRSREHLTTIACNFSVPLSLSISIITGDLMPEALAPWLLDRRREEILELADRITLELDPEMSKRLGGLDDVGIDLGAAIAGVSPEALGKLGEATMLLTGAVGREAAGRIVPTLEGKTFGDFKMRIPSRVLLTTTHGEDFAAEVDVPRGAAGRPIEETTELVAQKFLRYAGQHLGDEQAEEALGMIERMEELEALDELIGALVKTTSAKGS